MSNCNQHYARQVQLWRRENQLKNFTSFFSEDGEMFIDPSLSKSNTNLCLGVFVCDFVTCVKINVLQNYWIERLFH